MAKLVITFSFFVFISMTDLSVTPVIGQECPDTVEANQAIVDSIINAIKNNKNTKLEPQLSHINISSKNRVVKIQGWADNKKNRKAIYDIANGATCRKMVYDALFAVGQAAYDKLMKDRKAEDPFAAQQMRISADCPDGGKKCGDICIDEGDPCNN
jgi:hypothetical protein